MSDPPKWFDPSPPPVGRSATAALTVEPGLTAKAVGSGSLEVLATPAMAALMERAAVAALEGFLAEGWTSVGVSLNLKHEAASPLGARVLATAEVSAVAERQIIFQITVEDEGGRAGSAQHVRALVAVERFMARAAARLAGGSGGVA
jgi:predicted thioesterase